MIEILCPHCEGVIELPDDSYGHFVVEGGCPMPPLSTREIVGGFVCFGLILTIIGIETIRDKIRNR